MNRIKELRKETGIKQIDLCKQLGISQGTLSGWENGKYEPDLTSITSMANIFDVSVDYLLGVSDVKGGKDETTLTPKDEKDIQKTLEQMVSDLNSGQDGPAFYGGNMELSEYDREVLTRSLDDILHLIKLRNKEKYTPKKYRENSRDDYSL